ncbi:hypothetical protein C1930_14445 [Stenotrophomonas sp. SAU14A_NAIMI4_8]|nr:hypothetical protein C1930_14445 [Stenotrophomonas sp. SAU14A_NAIMI4_8]
MRFEFHSKFSIPTEINPRMAWIYCVDQGRHLPTAAHVPRWLVEPRHAWMHFEFNPKFSIPTGINPRMAWIYCVDQGRHLPTAAHVPRWQVEPRHAWMRFEFNPKFSIPTEIHPRMAWIPRRSRESVRGGAVSDCGVSAAWMRLPSLHGRTCGVPAIRHRPAIPRNAAFDVDVDVDVALSRCRAQPCKNPFHRSWLSLLPRRL